MNNGSKTLSGPLDYSKQQSLIPTFNTANAIFNLINSVIGVGIITLPYCFKEGGITIGIISIIFCCVLIVYTSDLMIKSAKMLGQSTLEEPTTYGDLCKNTLGLPLFYINCIFTFMMMFLAMCVYLVLLRKELRSVISDMMGETFVYEKYLLLGIAIFIILPLCMLKDISKLGFTSFISIVSVAVIIITVSIRAPEYHTLMKAMTMDRMIEIQKNLYADRNFWLCKLVFKNESNLALYTVGNERIETEYIAKETFDTIRSGKLCSNYKELDALLKGDTMINSAHTKYLFDLYSLEGDHKKRDRSNWEILATFGVYASAFICQQCTFSIYSQLKRKTIWEMRIVHIVAYIAICILCISFAYVGYENIGYQVGESVFETMKMRYYVLGDNVPIDWTINAGRILLSLTIILTFPMQNFFMRRNLFQLFYAADHKIRNVTYDSQNPSNIIYYSLTVFFFSLSLIVGLFLDKIIDVYSLMGAIFAAPLIYIIPCLCFMYIGRGIFGNMKKYYNDKNYRKLANRIILPSLVAMFGVFILILSGTSKLRSLLK